MPNTPNCPKCGLGNTYFDGMLFICPDCFHEFTNAKPESSEETVERVLDSNGTSFYYHR